MLKIYHGRCHCGGVELTAEFDLDAGTEKCNCTYCRRVRLWSVRTAPEQVSVTRSFWLVTHQDVQDFVRVRHLSDFLFDIVSKERDRLL